jgi:inner membrane transporter RhtA
MCLEPAFALLAGFALIGQVPRPWALAGIAFVIAAGLGAERTGARQAADQAGAETTEPDERDRHARPADELTYR